MRYAETKLGNGEKIFEKFLTEFEYFFDQSRV